MKIYANRIISGANSELFIEICQKLKSHLVSETLSSFLGSKFNNLMKAEQVPRLSKHYHLVNRIQESAYLRFFFASQKTKERQ